MSFRCRSLAILSCLVFACAATLAAEPGEEPSLEIETGNHTGWIGQIATDTQGRWLATVSQDKTLRVWGVASGNLLRTIRPPIGDEREGAMESVAMSPDGELIAASGNLCQSWDKTSCIYIFDRSSGRMVQRITGVSDGASRLLWTPDGKYLVAGLWAKNGIRVFRTSDYTQVAQDTLYGDMVERMDMSRDGRLATSSRDGAVRLYELTDGNLKIQAKKSFPQSKHPFGLAFSPDGKTLAVGFFDVADVVLASAQTLAPTATPKIDGLRNGGSTNLAWSADGQTLYSGGRADSADGKNKVIRAWSRAGEGAYTDTISGQRRVSDIRSLSAGGVVYATNGPAWGTLDSSGKRTRFLRARTPQFYGNQEQFRVSADGLTVRFGFEFTTEPARFNLREQRYEDATKSDDLLAARTTAEGFAILNWKDAPNTTINGIAVKLRTGENVISAAISPDNKTAYLGTTSRLRKVDAQGRELWARRVPGAVEGINLSADGELIIAAYQDGTIRWLRATDGSVLASLFAHADRRRWVAWSASGYYMASPGAEDLIGWHVNRGKDVAADFFPASRFRTQFYRPDILSKVIGTQNESEAVRLANLEAGRAPVSSNTRPQDVLPPLLEIVSPGNASTFAQGSVTLKYTVRTPQDAPLTAVRARVNGLVVNLADTRNLVVGAASAATITREISVPVPPQDSEIQLFAENKNGTSVPASVTLVWKGASEAAAKSKDAFDIKPKLYVLAMGVSNYDKAEYQLGLAAKDARDFAESLKSQKGRLYRDVEVRLLTDKQANRDAVLDGLDWLQKQVTAKDVGVLFMAGHGVNDATGVYYFLPSNADVDRLKSTAVVFSEIKNTLSNLAGKALFFVDTCHSGNVLGGRRGVNNDTTAVINELSSAENGVVVFSSSTGKQYSLEDAAWGNGAFTKALVEGFNGKADYNKNGRITHKMLDFYLSERVKELTGGRQTPVTQAPGGVPDFPIALSR